MKNHPLITFISLFLFFISCTNHPETNSAAAKAVNPGVHKKANEEVIYSFILAGSNKLALLCKDKDNKYLVYRFGTKDSLELEYPSLLDSTSWKRFTYSGYARAGGIENEGLTAYSVSFKNKGIIYKIYQESHSEDNSQATGILIKIKDKETRLTGNIQSVTGALSALDDADDLIPNSYAKVQQ